MTKKLTRRITSTFRNLYSGTTTHFVSAMLALLLAAITGRYWWTINDASDTLIRDKFRQTFGTPQEPRDNVRFPATISVALSELKDTVAYSCGPGANQCTASTGLLEATQRLLELRESDSLTEEEKAAILHDLDRFAPSGDGIAQNYLRWRLINSPLKASATPKHCHWQKPDDQPRCFYLKNRDFVGINPEPLTDNKRSKEEEKAMNALERAFSLIRPDTQPATGSRIKSIYFISKSNRLFLWQAIGKKNDALPRHRAWTNASYFQVFLSDPTKQSYTTHPYLDIGGSGVVTSDCRPAYKNSDLLGIWCVDSSHSLLSDGNLPHRLDSHPFLQFHVAEIFSENNTIRTSLHSDGYASELENAIQTALANMTISEISKDISEIKVLEESAFFVPVERTDPTKIAGLVITRKSENLLSSRWLWLLATSASVIFFMTILLLGHRTSARSADLSERIAVFRSLQVGVIETDQNDQIVRANDRAEEIICTQLPKSNNEPGPLYWGLIDLEMMATIENDLWTDGTDPPDPRYIKITQEQIASYRRLGQTTRYWAKLRDLETWIEVKAGPLIFNPGSSATGHTFGIIERATRARVSAITRSLNQ